MQKKIEGIPIKLEVWIKESADIMFRMDICLLDDETYVDLKRIEMFDGDGIVKKINGGHYETRDRLFRHYGRTVDLLPILKKLLNSAGFEILDFNYPSYKV